MERSCAAPPSPPMTEWTTFLFPLGAGYINGSANSRRLHSQTWVHNKPSMQLLSQQSSTGRFNMYLQLMYALKTMNLFADFTILDAHYRQLWFHQNSGDYFIVITFYFSVQFAHIGLYEGNILYYCMVVWTLVYENSFNVCFLLWFLQNWTFVIRFLYNI